MAQITKVWIMIPQRRKRRRNRPSGYIADYEDNDNDDVDEEDNHDPCRKIRVAAVAAPMPMSMPMNDLVDMYHNDNRSLSLQCFLTSSRCYQNDSVSLSRLQPTQQQQPSYEEYHDMVQRCRPFYQSATDTTTSALSSGFLNIVSSI